MIKNNFIVITGGPGAGKSTLLKCLHQKGFGYIEETARNIIKERISKGLSPRPEPAEFAKIMFDLDYKNYIDNLPRQEIIFFDRSFLDSAYLLYEADKLFFADVKDVLATNRFNTNVFIVPPWKEIYCSDDERDQTFEEAVNIYQKLYDWYAINEYKLVVLPKTSVDKRIEFMLSTLNLSFNLEETCRCF